MGWRFRLEAGAAAGARGAGAAAGAAAAGARAAGAAAAAHGAGLAAVADAGARGDRCGLRLTVLQREVAVACGATVPGLELALCGCARRSRRIARAGEIVARV